MSVTGNTKIKTREFETVGSTFLHMFTGWFHKETQKTDLLTNVTTAFAPGSLTIVIGPPESGKSTLLKMVQLFSNPNSKIVILTKFLL